MLMDTDINSIALKRQLFYCLWSIYYYSYASSTNLIFYFQGALLYKSILVYAYHISFKISTVHKVFRKFRDINVDTTVPVVILLYLLALGEKVPVTWRIFPGAKPPLIGIM